MGERTLTPCLRLEVAGNYGEMMIPLYPVMYILASRVMYVGGIGNSTSEHAPDSKDYLYLLFDENELTPEELAAWKTGARCEFHAFSPDHSVNNASFIYCPMPFEAASYSECCGSVYLRRCCENTDRDSGLMRWAISFGVILSASLVLLTVVCLYNRCSARCTKRRPTDPPRAKIKPTGARTNVEPAVKRILLKTANYTVEQLWTDIWIRFSNFEFRTKFKESLGNKYPQVTKEDWERGYTVKSRNADDVTLRIQEDAGACALLVAGDGNISWLKNEFQNVCKNMNFPEGAPEMRSQIKLSPRLPTIGEQFYNTDEYSVKISQTEIEVRFAKPELFRDFRLVLLYKFEELSWTRYNRRDCTSFTLESSKPVTLHLWEAVSSIWMSGPGKRDWYEGHFQELYSYTVTSTLPVRVCSDVQHKSSKQSNPRRRSPKQHSMTTLPYTVMRFDTGAVEVDFTMTEHLNTLKNWLQKTHVTLTWDLHKLRHVTTLKVNKRQTITLQFPTEESERQCLWIEGSPNCIQWFDSEFEQMLEDAIEYALEANKTSNEATQGPRSQEGLAPIESVV